MPQDIDRPYLSGYASSVLGLPDGPVVLGNMIAGAESKSELLNYTTDHIKTATRGLMEMYPADYLGKFLSTITKDKDRLWDAARDTFAAHIQDTLKLFAGGSRADNLQRLHGVIKKYPDLLAIYDGALAAHHGQDASHPAPSPT